MALLVTGAALAFAPSSAVGAATMGENFAPDQPCFAFNSFVQSGSPGNQYAAPTDGVITSWSHQAGPIGPSLKFKVLRPKGSNTFALVGESGLTPTVANQLNTFDIRIPVISGDLIGMFINPGPIPNCALLTPGDPSFEISFFVGDATVTDTVFTPQLEGKISLSAQLEPDADDDGFGDETQDLCPSDQSHPGSLPEPARIGRVVVIGPAKIKRGRTADLQSQDLQQRQPHGRGRHASSRPAGDCEPPGRREAISRRKFEDGVDQVQADQDRRGRRSPSRSHRRTPAAGRSERRLPSSGSSATGR